MFSKLLAPAALAIAMTLPAAADRTDGTGEVLAWTVAAYASCETVDGLQLDYREEVARIEANIVHVIDSLKILSEADNICGNLNTYANDMLALAETDMAAVEARLITFNNPKKPVFELEDPKGSQGHEENFILTESEELPPQSGPMPPSSDYQN